MKSLA
jgi:pyruvate dehydrogenase E1 component alpha subunit